MGATEARAARARRVRAVVLAAGALALVTPAIASAALSPVTPQDIGTGDFGYSFAAATGPQNQAAAIWTGQNNGPTTSGAMRPAGGPAGTLQTLSFDANSESPRLLFEPSGTALALWSHATNSVAGEYSVAAPGGAFSAPRRLPSGDRFADVAADASGRAVAVWKSGTGTTHSVTASSQPDGGSFQGSAIISPVAVNDPSIQPSVAANAGGQALAAWHTISGAGFGMFASLGTTTTLPNAGTPIATNAADVFGNPATAIGPTGDAAVVWSQDTGLVGAFRAPGGALGAPVPIAAAPSGSPAAVIDAAGTTTLAWIAGTTGSQVVRVATRPSGGVFGAPVDVSAVGTARRPDIGLDASGGILVSWSEGSSPDITLFAASRPAGGTFGAPVPIASGTFAGAVAVAPDGNVFAAWSVQLAPTSKVVRFGGLDNGTPPTISSVTAPTGAIAGTPAAIAVTPSDWSGIGSVTWDFGDGGAATGVQVSHAYGAAGAYTVTVRVTDGAGNATSATRRVEVPSGTLTQLLDRVAPNLTIFTQPTKIARAALLKPGVGVRVSSNEAATATFDLLASYNGRTLVTRTPNLVLASKSVSLLPGLATTVRLAPRAALVGSRAFRATVRITLRDALGNTRVLTKALTVTVPKPKPKKPKAKAKPAPRRT